MTDAGRTVESDGPHGGQPILTAGAPPDAAEVATVLVHGRGATANGILGLGDDLDRSGVHYVAPQATRSTWYPQSFMADTAANQPYLDSALDAVDTAVEVALDAVGDHAKVVLLGFSQGACLASEYALRNARRYGGVVALSGGLIGPEGTTWEEDRVGDGTFEGTPAFFGCSDRDPHIPAERVHESVAVYEDRGADVTERLYEGLGHTVNEDEMEWTRGLLDSLLGED